MKSKQDGVLEHFFNSSKHWHFEELRETARIGRPQLARWLKIFAKQGIIKRIKPKGKMPYYVQCVDSPSYKTRKKFFAWKKFIGAGLVDHLLSISDAKVIIIFGSFSRSDWYQDSDIDIFIYGHGDKFEQGKFELKLRRDIQVHAACNSKDLKKMNKLLPYILSGDFIKGSIQDLGVDIRA